MNSVGFAQQNDRASVGSPSANDRASETQIPVTRLGVSFVIALDDADALNFLHKTVAHANGRFDFKLTAFAAAAGPVPSLEAAEDWSKLVAPKLWLQRGRITEILAIEGELSKLYKACDAARAAAVKLGAKITPEREYHGPIPPPQPPAAPTAAAFDDDKMQVAYPDPLPLLAAAPAAPPPPPSVQKAETPAPKPAAPKSRAEALVMVANVAQGIGKTVPVTPQINAGPTKLSLKQRLVAKLRALYRAGDPIPGNKELGAELGMSKEHVGVALAQLKQLEAIDYEWRPAPTPEDQTLQRRFVTKA